VAPVRKTVSMLTARLNKCEGGVIEWGGIAEDTEGMEHVEALSRQHRWYVARERTRAQILKLLED